MKNISFVLAGATFIVTNPVLAQSAEEAAQEAMEAAAEAAEETRPVVAIPPPAPPAISVRPTARETARSEYPREPRPITRRRDWIKQADYPVSSWNAGEEGYVEFDLAVDADGNPTACDITASSGFTALDEATCPVLLERVKFEPALAEEGEPIAGTYLGSYTWTKREPEMPEMRITFQYLHDENGVTSECEFLSMEGDIPQKMLDDIERDRERGRLCPGGRSNRGVPYRDEDGVPVAKRVTVTFDVQLEDVAK